MDLQKSFVSAMLLVMLCASAFAQAPVAINGDWDGSLKVPAGIQMRLTLHLSGAAATMDSPDQSASGIPATLSRQGNTVTVAVPATKGSFTGTLSTDGKTLTGSFSQGSLSMPAHFKRRAAGAAAPELDRPQTPHPPFPYITHNVSFAGKNGDLLAGTLTMPKATDRLPPS